MTLFISLLSLFISFAMMFLTAFNYLKTWERQKFNIDYEFLNIYYVPNSGYYTHLRVTNNSSEPIAISGFCINGEYCDNRELFITGGSKMNQPIKTTQLPIYLESYGATEFYLYFLRKDRFTFADGLDIELRTSRAVITEHIEYRDGLLKPLQDLIKD
ncbi:hypothetical protein [Mammaliicoccus sciuri]|uniref:hypothetical protein n=1 Tax=Mammaliicoccus sciuri TaxID=1296 RepID=UPI000D1EB104|nr:hypothetical protein [Mammaliicoccus sciuri]PTK01392.1 hypothetical protein BUZ87_08395 [Mammaliicoccus sciuri]